MRISLRVRCLMLDLWMELPAWLRFGSALLLIGLGVLLLLYVSVRLGCVLMGVGCVLLLVGERSKSEKNGYRF
jgi:hypothetical protein